MPTYEYFCDACQLGKEVTKPMAESRREETCDQCAVVMRRLYSSKIQFTGEKVKDAEFYHSFGKVIKNDYERKEEMKRRNVIEVGNEKPDRLKYFTERYRREKLARGYDD